MEDEEKEEPGEGNKGPGIASACPGRRPWRAFKRWSNAIQRKSGRSRSVHAERTHPFGRRKRQIVRSWAAADVPSHNGEADRSVSCGGALLRHRSGRLPRRSRGCSGCGNRAVLGRRPRVPAGEAPYVRLL